MPRTQAQRSHRPGHGLQTTRATTKSHNHYPDTTRPTLDTRRRFERQVSVKHPPGQFQAVHYTRRSTTYLRAPASRQAVHSSSRDVATTTCSRARRVFRRRQRDIVKADVEAWMHLGATDTRRPLPRLFARQPTCEVGKLNVAHIHQARSCIAAIVARVLVDGWSCICAFDLEVRKDNVAHRSPATSSRLPCILIEAVCRSLLWNQGPYPSLD
jgi:hypothetical protein